MRRQGDGVLMSRTHPLKDLFAEGAVLDVTGMRLNGAFMEP
jgi:hypothetical protein